MASLVSYEQRIAYIHTPHGPRQIRYTKCCPPTRLSPKGTVVLLHDFFRTDYQFRHVIDLFAMSGYNTIAPDLSNLSGGESNEIAVFKNAVSCLKLFLDQSCPDTSIHIVGHGLGAHLASEIAAAYPDMIVSLVYSNSNSAESQLQQIMSLTATSSKGDSTRAFEADLSLGAQDSGLISRFDIEEYVESYSSPGKLANMQSLFAVRRAVQLPGLEIPNWKGLGTILQSDPELQPEDWAISILTLLNRHTKSKALPRQARL